MARQTCYLKNFYMSLLEHFWKEASKQATKPILTASGWMASEKQLTNTSKNMTPNKFNPKKLTDHTQIHIVENERLKMQEFQKFGILKKEDIDPEGFIIDDKAEEERLRAESWEKKATNE